MIYKVKVKHNKKSLKIKLKELILKDDHGIIIFNPSTLELNLNNLTQEISYLNEVNMIDTNLINNELVLININKEKYNIEEYNEYFHNFEKICIDNIRNGNIHLVIFIASNIHINEDFIKYLDENISDIIILEDE